MMSIKSVSLVVVFSVSVFALGHTCIAGTWYDDFSDSTLWDWGGAEGLEDDGFRAAANGGLFNFRGRRANGNLQLTNYMLGEVADFSLKMKFMVRNIQGPESRSWGIRHYTYDKESGKYEGRLDFEFRHGVNELEENDVDSMRIVVWQVVENGRAMIRRLDLRSRFEYEKEIWYTLTLDAAGNRYTFSVGDTIVETEDDSVPAGWIELSFQGRCNIWLDDFTVTGPDVPDGGPGFARAVLPVEKIATMWGELKSRD